MNSDFMGPQRCSFCRRTQDEVDRMISGPDGVFICNECVDLCREILEEEAGDFPNEGEVLPTDTPSPTEIFNHLNEYVIGQEQAKRVLSVAVYNHYKRIRANQSSSDVEIDKSNILIVGPTGVGKTLMAQTLARVLDVPFCITDATALTEAGYVGEDVENILLRLIQAADYDIKRAEHGIIYIDEIDKTGRKAGDNPSITRDVSGEGVQQALLKIIEGTVANVPPQGGRKHPHQEFLQIDTSNILFICAGTFAGIEELISKRVGSNGSIGFSNSHKADKKDKTQLLREINAEDLVKFGMIPEMVGRLPVLTNVEPLEEESLVRILTEPKNALVKQFVEMFRLDGVELVFTDDALAEAARQALKRETGARGLRSIIESKLLEVMFEIPSRSDIHKVIVNGEAISGETRPVIMAANEKTLKWSDEKDEKDDQKIA